MDQQPKRSQGAVSRYQPFSPEISPSARIAAPHQKKRGIFIKILIALGTIAGIILLIPIAILIFCFIAIFLG